MTMQLRDSQRVALERLTEPGRHFAALWAEPRSGKTAVALSWIGHVKPHVAVVVGPKVAEGVWRGEAAKWLSTPYVFHSLTNGAVYPEVKRLRDDVVNIMFVNYEQFTKLPWKRLGPFLRAVAKHYHGQGMMLLDESHIIKTPSSVMGRNIRPLAHHFHYRLLMTGTPVTNPDQIDAVYGQWTFLNPAIRDRWESARDFREYFGEWSTVKGFPELVRPRRQWELNQYIQPDVITMVGPGEPVPIRKVTYPVPDDVRRMHKEMLKEGVFELEGHDIVGLNPLVRLLRMRTLVAGWVKDDEGNSHTVWSAAKARLGALGKLIGRCDGKIIIAATHMWEVKLLRWYLKRKRLGYRVIVGSTPNKNHVIEDFQRDPDCRVLVVQPRTVAMAVDISVANDLIW